MIGRLKIVEQDLQAKAGTKIDRPWTSVFGKQKSDFGNTQGVQRPFCLSEFLTPYAVQEKLNPLLLVGEVREVWVIA